YCSCTGYGQTGPYSQRVGHDINHMGVSVILGVTGRHLGTPVVPGVPVADMTSGVFCALSICAALAGRMQSGEGRYIDISMTDCMVSYMHVHASALFGKNKASLPISGGHIRYETYETKDGKFITIGNVEDKFWFNFCDLIGRDDLKAYSFESSQNQETVREEIKKLFRKKTKEEWIALLEDTDTCYGPVNELDDVFADPQIKHREMYFEIDHPVEGNVGQIALPVKFSEQSQTLRSPPPTLGQHTDEVLRKAGYSPQEIGELKKLSVV
ncbi:MAG: CoA transferase, partial [Deltaproteobacteria bacterium]|nr:CoA transferase [Deltaproteobacteria bacterium]